jgi:hypothetical protein
MVLDEIVGVEVVKGEADAGGGDDPVLEVNATL